jgi:hypothetical protein
VMNSLYGRFGINPESTITEICNAEKYEWIRNNKNSFVYGDYICHDCYLVTYQSSTGGFDLDLDEWSPPANSAVQISAAITAYGRIHMYQYLNSPGVKAGRKVASYRSLPNSVFPSISLKSLIELTIVWDISYSNSGDISSFPAPVSTIAYDSHLTPP